MIFARLAWVYLLVSQVSAVTRLATSEPALFTVALGRSVQLNCTYNCSNGFTRGYWEEWHDSSKTLLRNGGVCLVSLLLNNVSAKDLGRNYTCITVNTEDLKPVPKVQRVVSLQLEAETSTPGQTETPTSTVTISTTTAKPEDEGGFIGIKVLATVTVAVAFVLAVLTTFLCLSRNKQNCNCKVLSDDPRKPSSRHSVSSLPQASHPSLSPVNGERVTLRIPTSDSASDTEVPYADIMITVRGVSTPELNQVVYLSPGDQNQWWRDEPRSQLRSSRSADRLHLPQPREISRKMSTNSEYAVITYA